MVGPYVSIELKEKNRGFRVKTYRELKLNMKTYLEESYNNKVNVYRTRRGEWGEWFEHWRLVNGKPEITEQGWC